MYIYIVCVSTSSGVCRSFSSGTSLVTKASLNHMTVSREKIIGIESTPAIEVEVGKMSLCINVYT